jgi:hypothetical protein
MTYILGNKIIFLFLIMVENRKTLEIICYLSLRKNALPDGGKKSREG